MSKFLFYYLATILIGFNNNNFQNINFQFPNPKIISSLEDILEKEPVDGKIIEREDISFYKEISLLKNIFGEIELPNKPLQIGKINKGGQGERIYHTKGHAITLSAYGGGVGSKTGLYKIGDKVRKLSPRECARLQGFPESFILPKSITEAQKQFGNSVSINTLQFIVNEISETILKNDKRPTARISNSKEWIQKRERYSTKIQQLAK